MHKQNKDKIKSYSGNKKLDYIMSYITMCSMYNMDINVDKKVYDDAQDPNINLSTFVTNIDNNSGVDASISHDITYMPRQNKGVASKLYHDNSDAQRPIITLDDAINSKDIGVSIGNDDKPPSTENSVAGGDAEPRKHPHIGGYCAHTYNTNNNMYSVLDENTIADTGADIDTISDNLEGITDIKHAKDIYIKGVNGTSKVKHMGSYEHVEGLNTKDGIVNSNSDINCLSIPNRTKDGWFFWAYNKTAQLIKPDNTAYNFELCDGLYRLTDRIHRPWRMNRGQAHRTSSAHSRTLNAH